MMNQAQIDENYEIFVLPGEQLPSYDDPNSFALRFKKFSLLKEVNTVYSDTSVIRTSSETR